MIRPLSGHFGTPHNVAAGDINGNYIRKARARDKQGFSVVRGKHIIDELVVALANQLLDRQVIGETYGVGKNLQLAFFQIGSHIDAGQPRIAGHGKNIRHPS